MEFCNWFLVVFSSSAEDKHQWNSTNDGSKWSKIVEQRYKWNGARSRFDFCAIAAYELNVMCYWCIVNHFYLPFAGNSAFVGQGSPFFQEEFPKLSAGDGKLEEKSKDKDQGIQDNQYGPGPSLRPQSKSWHLPFSFTILLESIKALVYEVYISVIKSQDKGKNPLVFIMGVLCIKNWLHASLHGFVEEFKIS